MVPLHFKFSNLQCFPDMLESVCERVLLAAIVLHKVVATCPAYDLIINIRDIHDIDYIIVEVGAQDSTENVKRDV